MALMTHPELPGATIDVAISAVPFHMASGWVPVDGAAVKAAEEAKKVSDAEEAAALKANEEAIAQAAAASEAPASPSKTTKSAKES